MFKDLGLKFTALILAIIFWIGVVSLKNNIKYFQDPVEIKPFNITENLTLADSLGKVELKLEAPQETYANLSINDFEAYIDLKGLGAGEHNVPVQVTSKNPKVKVVKIEPSNVAIKIEEITSKVLNVNVEVKGGAAENFEAQDPVYVLKEVEIKGPKNLVDKAVAVKAVVVLKGVEMVDVKSEISPMVFDKDQKPLEGLSVLPASLEVSIPILQIQKYKTVGVRANLVGDLGTSGYFVKKVSLSPSTIVIQGNTQDLQEIDYIETEAIDIGSLEHNTLKRVELIFPEGVNAQDVLSVLLTLEIEKISQ